MLKAIGFAIFALALSGCVNVTSVTGPDWRVSCSLPRQSAVEVQENELSFNLQKGDYDGCASGSLRKNKQRAEILRNVNVGEFYTVDFDFNYSAKGGGSSIFQIHPGASRRQSSSTAALADPFNSCENIDLQAGFTTLHLSIPGAVSRAGSRLLPSDYKDQWHHVKVIFKADNGKKGVYRFIINGEEKYNIENKANNVCFYSKTANIKLGLYRGKQNMPEKITYKNIKVRKGIFE